MFIHGARWRECSRGTSGLLETGCPGSSGAPERDERAARARPGCWNRIDALEVVMPKTCRRELKGAEINYLFRGIDEPQPQ
jgi:hypothetical protein